MNEDNPHIDLTKTPRREAKQFLKQSTGFTKPKKFATLDLVCANKENHVNTANNETKSPNPSPLPKTKLLTTPQSKESKLVTLTERAEKEIKAGNTKLAIRLYSEACDFATSQKRRDLESKIEVLTSQV